ncbi:MAG: hypothetical protein MCM46_00545 [Candidatus Manganitrophus sp. SB1]|nr:hypothetical protein [Candidatus Manganitrophus morganii]
MRVGIFPTEIFRLICLPFLYKMSYPLDFQADSHIVTPKPVFTGPERDFAPADLIDLSRLAV